MDKQFDFELVVKIGSMALIRKNDNDLDYNIFSRLGAELKPGYILVSSGATEIGRLDYMKRNEGHEIEGDLEDLKADYSSQGQNILMETYRQFISPKYSVRQILVEHQHFNDPEKREHMKQFLLRARAQGAVPIINYNDPVNYEETRKMELSDFRKKNGDKIVECVDNDETAAVIAKVVKAKYLILLTSVEGIYRDQKDPDSLVESIVYDDPEKVIGEIRELQKSCIGASRKGANGAKAKLEYVIDPIMQGTTVIIGHARHRISELLDGSVKRTILGIK